MRVSTTLADAAAAETPSDPSAGADRERRPRAFASSLAVIVAGALLLRAVTVWWIPTQPVSDFWSYVTLAERLLNDHTYAWQGGDVTAYLAPGYPLLLAVVFAMTGVSSLAVTATNVLLATATVLTAGLAGRALLGSVAGLAAAALVAVDPRQLLLACLAASENLGTPTLLAFLWLLGLSWRRERSLPVAALAGLALGVSALARPVGLLAWVLWPACGVLARKEPRRVAQETLLLLAVVYSLLLPWGLRNLAVLGRYTTSTTTAGINFFMGNSDAASGSWISWRPALAAVRPESVGAGEGDVDRIAADEARRWIAADPARAARFYLHKLWLYCCHPDYTTVAEWAIYLKSVEPPLPARDVLPGPHALKNHRTLVSGVLVGTLGCIVVLACIGAVRLVGIALLGSARRRRLARPASLALLGLVAYFPLVTAVFIVVDRYRWPLEDVLTLLAGGGVAAIAQLVRRPSA